MSCFCLHKISILTAQLFVFTPAQIYLELHILWRIAHEKGADYYDSLAT